MSWLPPIEKLDLQQKSAVDFVVAHDGNFYIKGEAGTGKSVVLAHIAMRYKTANPEASVAVLTYTNAMADYLAEGMADNDVHTQTILREINHPKRGYDLLIVDEAQDIRKEWVAIFKKIGRRFVFAADFDQMIYGRTANIITEDELKRQFDTGNPIELKRDYRLPKSHRELLRIAYLGGRTFNSEITRKMELPNVEVYHAKTWHREAMRVHEFLKGNAETCKPAAALFDRNNKIRKFLEEVVPGLKEKFDGQGDSHFFGNVNACLSVNSQYRFLGRKSDDLRKILADDCHDNMIESGKKPLIYLMTYHGSKGLDFDTVAIPNLGSNGANVRFNTFYVAMTRCRRNLLLSYNGKAGQQIESIRALGKHTEFTSEYNPDPIQEMLMQKTFWWE